MRRVFALTLALSLLTASSVSAQSLNLIAEYSFNETSGSTAFDSSGLNNNAAITGASHSSNGQFSYGLSFVSGNRVTGPSVSLTPGFTYMAWINNPSRQSYETIVTVGGNRNFYLRNGVPGFYNGSQELSFGSAIPNSSWRHIAFVSTGTTVRVYVNGSAWGSTRNLTLTSYTGNLMMGAWPYGGSYVDYFSGLMDEVRIFNSALTQAQIQTLMNTPISSTSPSATPTPPTSTPVPPTPTSTPTPSQIPTPTNVPPTPTPTLPTPTPTNVPPTPTPTPPPPTTNWNQHAGNAQHTGYVPDMLPSNWEFAWQWNGSNSTGGLAAGHIAPNISDYLTQGLYQHLIQPVTGNGLVYIPYNNGTDNVTGITALSETDGSLIWDISPGGRLNASAAYDPDTQTVFVGSLTGIVYKINSATGQVLSMFTAAAPISTPVLLASDSVYISAGNYVYRLNKFNMTQTWRYDAGAFIQQVPAYSPSRDLIIVGSSDGTPDGTGYENLNVIAIRNSDGTQAWRVDPNPALRYQPDLSFDPPAENIDAIEWENGWPVIAEQHGYVLMQLRSLWWYEIDGSVRYPTNSQWRTYFQNNPDRRKLYVLDLDDGSQPFLTTVLNAGFNNSNYSPMGPQPVIKTWPNGDEVAYTITYNSTINGPCTNPVDRQCSAGFAELLLDDQTVSGYTGGDVRLIRGNQGDSTIQTDEHGYMSMAGDMFFYNHWAYAAGHRITNRDDSLGLPYSNAIQAGIDSAGNPNLLILTENNANGTCAFSPLHYCPGIVGFEQGSRNWTNGGFYVYRTTNRIYDQYWTEGVHVVITNNRLIYRSNDGSILVLRPQNP